MLKSRVSSILPKSAALRINLNLDGHHHTDTHIYILSLALTFLIHNKQQKKKRSISRGLLCTSLLWSSLYLSFYWFMTNKFCVHEKTHDWVVDQLGNLFHTTHRVKTQQVVKNWGHHCQWCRGARALVQCIHCTTARTVHVHFFKIKILKKRFFLLILNRKRSCWFPTFLMKRVLCICNGCGILETTYLASTNVN